MKTILFIDDEKNILNALKRLFRELNYDCYFAINIKEAIQVLLEVEHIDMLVTDIRMPHFDGIRVLKLFKEASPHTIRIALSGYAPTGSITEAISKNLAKQYFHKPWNNQELVENIDKMFHLEETLECLEVFDFAQKFEGVKTIPKLFNEVNLAIQEDQNVEKITDIISRDAAVTSNILRVANSAFYAARTGNLQQAIMFIGLNNLKQIILSCEIAEVQGPFLDKSEYIWKHSALTNKVFQELYETYYRKKIPPLISTAGLMHDIGKIIMLQIFGDVYYDKILCKPFKSYEYNNEEKKLFQADHSLIGGYFLNWWTFPSDIIEMTMYHHEPTNPNVINPELVALMCIASQIAKHEERFKDESFLQALEILKIDEIFLDPIIKKYLLEGSNELQ